MKNAMVGGMILSAALFALVMPQSAASVGAYAQTPTGSSLTADALDNATYQPVETDAFGDSPVQLTNGSYSSVLHYGGYDQSVIISQRSDTYAFGDLNGDGADDAAAIVFESTTGTAHGIFTVLAVYVNDGGTPRNAVTVSLSPMGPVTLLAIKAGVVTVSGKQLGPNDAFCCPSQPVTKQFILDTSANQLVDGSGASSSTTGQLAAPAATTAVAGGVPPSTADVSSVRSAIPGPGGQSGFAGQVLMPPPGLQPFASLQLFSAAPVLGEDPLSTDSSQIYPQSYSLWFVNAIEQSQRQFGVGGARIAGASSRQMYDDTAADFLKTFTACAPTAAYCGRPNLPPCTGMGCIEQAEIFHGLKVKGADALVLHWRADKAGGVGWDVTWFDSQAGVSYRLTTSNGADPGDFDAGLSANNQAGAQQLAAVAERLVLWTGT
jgi:hypothetical protein